MRSLEQYWYRFSPLHLFLWPLSLLFGAVAAARRALYRAGFLKVTKLSVPVIVVGNITIGGTGKTPLVIWLTEWLRDHGYVPGVVCRGYASSGGGPRPALPDSDPASVGDEAVLLARRCASPVWVGADRVAAAQALLRSHAECNVILSDDGLQHYALGRAMEVAVIDGERGFGNRLLLPAGPLREPLQRLDAVDAVVINGPALFARDKLPHEVPAFDMQLGGSVFYDVLNPEKRAGPERFAQAEVHAVAAIGNPERFFNQLRELGLSFTAHPFPDHHAFSAADFAFAGDAAVLMTEKDAVKCERFCNENFWALPAEPGAEPALGELVLQKIAKRT
jgi:tetraacyldisaccharide 4'-kinase